MKNNEEEVELYKKVQYLRQQEEIARQQNNVEALREIYFEMVDSCCKFAQFRAYSYDFVTADAFEDMAENAFNWLKESATEEENYNLKGKLYFTKAIILDMKGTHSLFVNMDYVDASITLQQAEEYYNQTGEIYLKQGGKPSDPIFLGTKGMALRICGIRLLGQGRYEIEAGNNKKAQKQLRQSVRALKQAAKRFQPFAERDKLGPESGTHPNYALSLSLYAQAFFYRAKAEQYAFELRNYRLYTKFLRKQIEALERAKEPLLRLMGETATDLLHRLGQDIELCEKRQKFFAAESEKQPKRSFTLGTITFAALALGSILVQIFGFNYFNLEMEKSLYIITTVFALTIGGVGAGLTTWGEATAFFREVVTVMINPKDKKEEKVKKNVSDG